MPSIDKRGPINILEVEDTQDLPGIYVWYARFDVGKADWHEDYAGGNKQGKFFLSKALRTHSEKFSQQHIQMTAVANFSSIWKGILEEDAEGRWNSDKNHPDPFAQHSELDAVLERNHTREALLAVIDQAFPLFMSPLYVGLTIEQTLKQRLGQHKRLFSDLWEAKLKSGAIQPDFLKAKSFAERAICLGFSPEDLYCYSFAITSSPGEVLTTDDLANIITSSEWILNRWTTPVLGRR